VEAGGKKYIGYNLADYNSTKDIVFSYKDQTFRLDEPSFVKDDDIWVPVGALLKKIEVMFIKTDEDGFAVIRGDGLPLELKVGSTDVLMNKAPYLTIPYPPALREGAFYISIGSLSKVIGISCEYDEAAKTIELARGIIEEFETFSLPKPKEVVEKKETAPPPPPMREPVDVREELLPKEYARDIDLKLDFNMSYLENKAADDRTRQAEWYLTGRTGDFTTYNHYRMKDFRTTQKERFKQDAEFISLTGRDLSLKLLDNFFNIPTLRSQTQPYFGGEITHYYNPYRTMMLYGKTDNTIAGPAAVGSVRYYGQLFIMKESYSKPTSPFKTAETFIVWENNTANSDQAGTTKYPRRNLAFITENTFGIYKGLNLDFSYGFSNFQPDNKVNASLMDRNWKMGAIFTQERFSVSTAYEYVGPQYASIGIPDTYEDYEGWDFSTNVRFTKNWYGNIGAQLYRNNVERNPRIQTSFNKSLTASTGLELPWQQSVAFGYTITEAIGRGGDQDNIGNRYQNYRVDYTKMWGNMTAQISYDHYNLVPFMTSTGGSTTDMASMSLFNYYPEINNSYLRFYQSYRKIKAIAAASYTTEYGDTTVSGRLNVTNYLSQTVDWRVSYTLREAFRDTAIMTLDVGTEWKITPASLFNFNFTLNNYDLYNEKTWIPKSYTLLFRGRHIFDIYTPDKWGSVRVFVYKDLNSNGAWDAGEPGIKDVRVYVANGRSRFTDQNGAALIKEVVPGRRQVKADLSTLPLNYVTRGPSAKPITIKSMQQERVEFPIVKTGSITGRVYIDNNDNGQYDRRVDEALPNARVYLEPGGRDTLTLSDGSYYFDYAYPGTYNICVDLNSIPEGIRVKDKSKVSMTLQEGDSLKGIDFIFLPKKVDVQYVSE